MLSRMLMVLQQDPPFELDLGKLAFRDKSIEQAFRSENNAGKVLQARVAVWLGFFMYPGFLGLDYLLIPADFQTALAIRLTITVLFAPGLYLSMRNTEAQRWVEEATIYLLSLCQLGHLLLIVLTGAPAFYGWGITAIIIVFMFTFARVLFVRSLILGGIMLATFEAVICLTPRFSLVEVVAANFFLISIGLAALMAGYVIEYQIRANFVQKQLTEDARAASDKLLLRILPASVAQELKLRGEVEPLFYESVTVLFTDFVGFTGASSRMMPDELVGQLDGFFSQFDAIAHRNGLEKLKTIGDAYMCAGGLPDISPTHAIDACLAALELRAFMLQTMNLRKGHEDESWEVRIGVHSGPVIAGVIGTAKFAYDIWGDTVNTASRMESSGRPGEINISGETYALVKDFFECEFRGLVEAKGKGQIEMYFLRRILPDLAADDDGIAPNGKFLALREKLSYTLERGDAAAVQ